MAIIDGRKLAEKIRHKTKKHIAGLARLPRLGILEVGADPVVARFVSIKKKVGDSLGVEIVHTRLSEEKTTEECVVALAHLCEKVDGVIVQLPLPAHIDTDTVLNAIPQQKDIDVLGEDAVFAYEQRKLVYVPPVAGAMAHIFAEGEYTRYTNHDRALIVGMGRLVGKPVRTWIALHTTWQIDVVDDTVRDLREHTLEANVIISGAGVPGLITPDMVIKNVVLIDAGTSEHEGALVGDIDPACADGARIFTPVPGGVGPVTVAVLYENLVKATELSLFE